MQFCAAVRVMGPAKVLYISWKGQKHEICLKSDFHTVWDLAKHLERVIGVCPETQKLVVTGRKLPVIPSNNPNGSLAQAGACML